MGKRILFVDDEENILEGVRRTLRSMRAEWDMFFAPSGVEALNLLKQQAVDIIVTDMLMPGMNGAELLSEVMRLYPNTIRFILSGQSDKEACFRSAGIAHQFLKKPCNVEEIKEAINRAFLLRGGLADEKLMKIVSRITTLPTFPDLYSEMMQELRNPDVSLDRIGKIIEQDMAMSARVLQLVNSAFFGLTHRISNPTQAAALLGIESLKSMVLVAHIFKQYEGIKTPLFSLNALWSHSIAISMYSFLITNAEAGTPGDMDVAYTAGLLHDVGKLVFAVSLTDQYEKALSHARDCNMPVEKAEKEFFGATHADVGAYLLGLWGLPDSIVEAILYHHRPGECLAGRFGPLTSIHAAHLMEKELSQADGRGLPVEIDAEYFNRIGVEERIAAWKELCLGVPKKKSGE
ncbi:MAG: hypothetical protein A2283_12190 [Lentisphaerae bacterium RIFOXYA12_FULL_48_11]|nr:MAG: hypothetical protein A2283_12190 [Lentisphaerae bacterium RIFOXYA12_FULL_48_11]